MTHSERRVPIDAIDRTIIRLLQEDGRMPFTELARHVDLTPPAVRARMQRLIDLGAMQIVAITRPEALGMPVVAMLGIRVDGNAGAVCDEISKIGSAIYIVQTAGSFDLFAEVVCKNMDALWALVNEQIRTIHGIRDLEVFPYFGIHTERYAFEHPD